MVRAAALGLLCRASASSLARAARPVPIHLLAVAKGGRADGGGAAAAAEWAEKLRRYAPVVETLVRPNPSNSRDPEVARAAEGERVLRAVPPGAWQVALDERGREVRSEDVAALLAAAGDAGATALVFAVGGPHGHPAAVRAAARDVVRLSPLVLNHSVARIVLLEQLYRGWTILRGEPYHHV